MPQCTQDGTAIGPPVLYVVELAGGRLLWQRELPATLFPAGWTLDGAAILLNGSGPNDDAAQPVIWRARADGTDELEMIIEDAYLLAVVEAWQ